MSTISPAINRSSGRRESSLPTTVDSSSEHNTVLGSYALADDSAPKHSASGSLTDPQLGDLKARDLRLTKADIKQILVVDKRIKGDIREQHGLINNAEKLYNSYANTSVAPPSSSGLWSALTWLASKCGFGGAQAKLDSQISATLLKARKKGVEALQCYSSSGRKISTSLLHEEKEVSKKFRDHVFELNKNTPKILKEVSVPVDKEHLPFQDLKAQLQQLASSSGGRIKMRALSDERLVLYRQKDDKSWESLELSWRGLTKVNVVSNGKLIGNLFNCDAIEMAKKFVRSERVSLKRRAPSQDNLRKVIAL